MDYKTTYYPESMFGGFTDIDGTIAFYTRVRSLINSSSVVVDVGCGRGAYAEDPVSVRRELRAFKGRCKRVIGIDFDRNARGNPFLDEFRLIEGAGWPLQDEWVDVCVCDNVLEHVEDPELFFSECQRVTRPGGYLCIRTPNALGYVALLSELVPNKLHAALLRKVQLNRREADVFRTLYRCNTKRRIRRMFDKHGFEHCVYGYEAEPCYLSFSHLSYFLGVIYQRLAPNCIRNTIFGFGRKKPSACKPGLR